MNASFGCAIRRARRTSSMASSTVLPCVCMRYAAAIAHERDLPSLQWMRTAPSFRMRARSMKAIATGRCGTICSVFASRSGRRRYSMLAAPEGSFSKKLATPPSVRGTVQFRM